MPKRITVNKEAVYEFTYSEGKLQSFTLSTAAEKEIVECTRNNSGLLTDATIKKNGVTTNRFIYERDASGRLIRMKYTDKIVHSYKYGNDGYVTAIEFNGYESMFKQNNGNVQQQDVAYSRTDQFGQPLPKTITTVGLNYQYDDRYNPFYLIDHMDSLFPFLGLTIDPSFLLTWIPSTISKNNLTLSPSFTSSPTQGAVISPFNTAVRYDYVYNLNGWVSRKKFTASYDNKFKDVPDEIIEIRY